MIPSSRAPESGASIVINPPGNPEIKGYIFKLAEAPRVRALIVNFGLAEDFPVECWYSVVLEGRFFGEGFEHVTAELIGTQISIESVERYKPCRMFQYGDLFSESKPLLLWRQRIFYQAENIWTPSVEITLSPTYPQVPFLESVWNPIHRNQKIVLSSPINTAKSEEKLLVQVGKKVIGQMKQSSVGRPAIFKNQEEFLIALGKAAEQLESDSQPLTQPNIAGLMQADEREIRRWCDKFEVKWSAWRRDRKAKPDKNKD